MFTGIEGDSSFDDVCVQATLGPGGVFETPLTVTLIGTAGTASELLLTCNDCVYITPSMRVRYMLMWLMVRAAYLSLNIFFP